jgi:NAD(P)-dependent dehydrogenase (short-subunit alcohol dehydrogenase family)
MKNIVVTGATSGIGLAVVKQLIKKNENVIAIGINQEECDSTYQGLGKPENVMYIPIDLSSNKEIKKQALKISEHFDNYIDVLINCAGIVPKWYQTNEQGYEMQLQVNHLAVFNLSMCLLDSILNAKGLIFTTSSRVHRHNTIDFNDLNQRKKYFLLTQYQKTKLCNVLFTHEFNRRYMKKGVIAYAMDPGLVNTTIGARNSAGLAKLVWNIRRRFGQDPIEVANFFLGVLYSDRNLTPPYYYKYGKQLEPSDYSTQEDVAKKLWEVSELYVK